MEHLGRLVAICFLVAGGALFFTIGEEKVFAGMEPVVSVNSTRLPEALVLLPFNVNAVLVEKSSQQVFLFSSNSNGVYERLKFPCSTGASGGNKLRSGDQKTPEGVYFLTDEYEERYLAPVYGKKAFPTDYPNFLDRKEGKNGSAIWLHGTNKKLKPMDSNGCVAMDNQDILQLAQYLAPGATPVVMVEKVSYSEPATINGERKALLSLLSSWEKAIDSGTYHEYLSLYDSDYIPDIEWWQKWLSIRKQAAENKLKIRIFMDSPGIYREKSVFVLFFDMGIELENRRTTLGKRKLFVEKKGDTYRISGDMFQTFPKGEGSKTGLIAVAAEKLYLNATVSQSPKKTVDEWLAAWSSKDIKTYGNFYSATFISDGMNKKKWVERKLMLAEKYDFIKVGGSDFKIVEDETTAVVSFVQDYQVKEFREKGIKTLLLVKEEEEWRIYRESWKKN